MRWLCAAGLLFLGCATSHTAAVSAPEVATDAGLSASLADGTVLAAVAMDPSAAPEARAQALRGLVKQSGSAALSVEAACLTAAEPITRAAAAEGLGVLGGKEARAALSRQLDRETDPAVRGALEKSLAKSEP